MSHFLSQQGKLTARASGLAAQSFVHPDEVASREADAIAQAGPLVADTGYGAEPASSFFYCGLLPTA